MCEDSSNSEDTETWTPGQTNHVTLHKRHHNCKVLASWGHSQGHRVSKQQVILREKAARYWAFEKLPGSHQHSTAFTSESVDSIGPL